MNGSAPVVVSIGGSILLTGDDDVDVSFLAALAERLVRCAESVQPFVVVGGGPLARRYIGLARRLGSDDTFLDTLGIGATRMNARLLIAALSGRAPPEPVERFEDAQVMAKLYPVVVMGGTHPGHTTDAVGALLSERVGAVRFVNATNVTGVYTADPRTDPDATLIPRMTHEEVLSMVRLSGGAGVHVVIDPLAAVVLARSRIVARVVDGRDLDAMEAAILGRPGPGTVVVSEG